MFEKIYSWIKTKINSIRISPLLSFFIAKSGKINPTLDKTLKDAPTASQNWVRLGLDRITSLGLPVWKILLLPFAFLAVKFGAESLQFFIDIIAKGVLLIPLAVILYFIWKTYRKK